MNPKTFLFTDIEGSTGLWELHPVEMRVALAKHDDIIKQVIEQFGGTIFKTIGDQFCATFDVAANSIRALRELHFLFYYQFSQNFSKNITGSSQAEWMFACSQEIDNLQAAIRWAQQEPDHADKNLELATNMWQFWYARGFYSDGRNKIVAALSSAPDAAETTKAKALNAAGILAINQSDFPAAMAYYNKAIETLASTKDESILGSAYNGMGLVRWYQGDLEEAQSYLTMALKFKRLDGDKAAEGHVLNNLGNLCLSKMDYRNASEYYVQALKLFKSAGNMNGAAITLTNLGVAARSDGSYQIANTRFEESLNLFRSLNNTKGIAHSLCNGGITNIRIGETDKARAWLQESLSSLHESGDQQGIAEVFEGFGSLSVELENWADAAVFFGFAETLRETIGAPLTLAESEDYNRETALLKSASPETASQYWKRGSELSMDIAIAFALGLTPQATAVIS